MSVNNIYETNRAGNLKQKQKVPQCCVTDHIRFRSGRPIPASKVSIQTNITKLNLSRFCEQNKSKTIKVINLKQSLKVAQIL